MIRKQTSVALALLAYGALTCAQTTPVVSTQQANAREDDSSYVGASTRVGLGYDDKTRLRGELYRVLSESETAALLGEAWISRNSGGLKFQPARGREFRPEGNDGISRRTWH